MNKKRAYDSIPERHGKNPCISVHYEIMFKGKSIEPGTRLKIKGESNPMIFQNLAHHSELDSTWIDVMDEKDGQFRSFRVDRIVSIVEGKRSRVKKELAMQS